MPGSMCVYLYFPDIDKDIELSVFRNLLSDDRVHNVVILHGHTADDGQYIDFHKRPNSVFKVYIKPHSFEFGELRKVALGET